MPGLEQLVQTYGYPALLIGTFLEGETILILAGFAAHRGYMTLTGVLICAFAGSLSGDQFWYFVGRTKGTSLIAKRPTWVARAERVHALLHRYQYPVMLGFRFLYGLRNITPFVIGASGFSPVRFAILNAIGAAVWAAVVACGGYFLGEVMETYIANFRKYEIRAGIAIAAVGAVVWVIVRLRMRARARRSAAEKDAGGTV